MKNIVATATGGGVVAARHRCGAAAARAAARVNATDCELHRGLNQPAHNASFAYTHLYIRELHNFIND